MRVYYAAKISFRDRNDGGDRAAAVGSLMFRAARHKVVRTSDHGADNAAYQGPRVTRRVDIAVVIHDVPVAADVAAPGRVGFDEHGLNSTLFWFIDLNSWTDFGGRQHPVDSDAIDGIGHHVVEYLQTTIPFGLFTKHNHLAIHEFDASRRARAPRPQ